MIAGLGAAFGAGRVERLRIVAVPGVVAVGGVDDGDAGRGHQAGGDGGEDQDAFHGEAPLGDGASSHRQAWLSRYIPERWMNSP